MISQHSEFSCRHCPTKSHDIRTQNVLHERENLVSAALLLISNNYLLSLLCSSFPYFLHDKKSTLFILLLINSITVYVCVCEHM